jgi:hypothetical protein
VICYTDIAAVDEPGHGRGSYAFLYRVLLLDSTHSFIIHFFSLVTGKRKLAGFGNRKDQEV